MMAYSKISHPTNIYTTPDGIFWVMMIFEGWLIFEHKVFKDYADIAYLPPGYPIYKIFLAISS